MKVLITGGGVIGHNHAKALLRLPGVDLAGVAEPVETAAKSFAEEYGLTAFSSQSIALAEAEFDLVVICTPSGTHADLAEEALRAGKHVVIEKPVEVSLARARALAQLSASLPGQVCSVISQHRFDPASIAVAHTIAEGGLGSLTSAAATVPWWREQSYYDSAEWRGTLALDGGASMNQGIHTIDLLRWFLGEVEEVTAFTGRLAHDRLEVEDVAAAAFRFASGSLATFHATTAAYPGQAVRLQIHGTRGTAVIHDDELEYLGAAAVPVAAKPQDAFIQGHQRQYADVISAIREGRPPGVTVEDGVKALAIVTALYRSAAEGRTVRVSEEL